VHDAEHFEDLSRIEDLIFVKALPLNENEVNEDNLTDYQDLEEVFHSFNIDLMFTLETMSTKFVQDSVRQPEVEQIGYVLASKPQFGNKNSYKEQSLRTNDDEEEEKEVSPIFKESSSPRLILSGPGQIRNKKASRIKEYTEGESHDQVKTSAPLIEDQSQSEQSSKVTKKEEIKEKAEEVSESYKRETFGIANQGPSMNQQVGRIEQKVEPDKESIHISRHGNSSRHEGHTSQKSLIQKSLDASNNSQTRSFIKKNTLMDETLESGQKSIRKDSDTASLQKSSALLEKSQIKDLDDSQTGILEGQESGYIEDKKDTHDRREENTKTGFFASNESKPESPPNKEDSIENLQNKEGSDWNAPDEIQRKGTIYDNNHYDKMAETLKEIDVSGQQDDKFEEIMRAESMNIKLGQFDKVSSSFVNKLPVMKETHEREEQDQSEASVPSEFRSQKST